MTWRNALGWSLLALVACGLFAAISFAIGILGAACTFGGGILSAAVLTRAIELTMDRR